MEMEGYAINVIFIILLDILSSVSMIRLYLLRNDVGIMLEMLVPKTLSFSPYL